MKTSVKHYWLGDLRQTIFGTWRVSGKMAEIRNETKKKEKRKDKRKTKNHSDRNHQTSMLNQFNSFPYEVWNDFELARIIIIHTPMGNKKSQQNSSTHTIMK